MNNNTNILANFNQIDKQYLSYSKSLVYLNIRSLRLNFSSFLVAIHNIINKIEIIILVETNINDHENCLFEICGFNSVFLNRGGRGGGIVVYIKENIKFKEISVNTISCELLKLKIKTKNEEYFLLATYRPPNQKPNEFITEIETIISRINKKQQIILIGDMNIDILKENSVTTKYLDLLLSNGMQCMVTEITREDINKNTQTCIDHIFIKNKQNSLAYTAVIKTTITDHFALFYATNNNQVNQHKEKVRETKYTLNNYTVCKQIKETNWNELSNNVQDTNELYYNIYNKFSEIYNRSLKETKASKKRSPNPWISEEIIKQCDYRDKLYRKWQNNKKIKQRKKNINNIETF